MSPSSGSSRRPFLERPVAIVSILAGVVGIASALYALTNNGGEGGSAASELTAGARVDACVREHGLAGPYGRTDLSADRYLFRACSWPPKNGAGPDGFTEIAVVSDKGPGRSEAEGLTVAHTFTTECRDIDVVYRFDNMGQFSVEPPLRLSKGEIRRVEDGSIWAPRNDTESAYYGPRRDQSVIMANLRYTLDSVRCA